MNGAGLDVDAVVENGGDRNQTCHNSDAQPLRPRPLSRRRGCPMRVLIRRDRFGAHRLRTTVANPHPGPVFRNL